MRGAAGWTDLYTCCMLVFLCGIVCLFVAIMYVNIMTEACWLHAMPVDSHTSSPSFDNGNNYDNDTNDSSGSATKVYTETTAPRIG